MGNSKDGKLGLGIIQGIKDIELPVMLKSKIKFYKHKMIKIETKKYEIFDDYDDYGKLKKVWHRDSPFEITQIRCGNNFQVFLTCNGELYTTGSNVCGQLGLDQEESEDDDEDEETDEEEEGKKLAEMILENEYIPEALQDKIENIEKRKEYYWPQRVRLSHKVKYLAVGAQHVIAIMENEQGVYSWG